MSKRSAKLAPYLMVFPTWIWLIIFFVVPLVVMLSVSTMTGSDLLGFKQTWHFSNYGDAWSTYHPQILRSLKYGAIATAVCILIGYPVAYRIAFFGGKYKSLLLFMLLLPFFVSFVIRTLAWEFLLGEGGWGLAVLKWLHLDSNGNILQTQTAVVGGLVYNFLPFTILPIYVALERVSPSLLEAASDLYANKALAFIKVIFPLSAPGVFAAFLLTFVPVASDFVTAQILGGPGTTMVGTIIEQRFNSQDYPIASALSFILMFLLLMGIFIYAKIVGTDEAIEMAAA